LIQQRALVCGYEGTDYGSANLDRGNYYRLYRSYLVDGIGPVNYHPNLSGILLLGRQHIINIPATRGIAVLLSKDGTILTLTHKYHTQSAYS